MLELYSHLDQSIIRETKIDKVLRKIEKDQAIPCDKFDFRSRAGHCRIGGEDSVCLDLMKVDIVTTAEERSRPESRNRSIIGALGYRGIIFTVDGSYWIRSGEVR